MSVPLLVIACGPASQPQAPVPVATHSVPVIQFLAQAETVPMAARNAVLLDLSGRGRIPLEYGTWRSDKPDPRAEIRVEAGDAGPARQRGFKITYDISQEAGGARAFAGIWIKPSYTLNLTKSERMILVVKAEQPGTDFYIQLKSDQGRQSAQIAATGATEEWGRIVAPLSAFAGIMDLGQVEEINLSFDPAVTKSLDGVFHLAEIRFE